MSVGIVTADVSDDGEEDIDGLLDEFVIVRVMVFSSEFWKALSLIWNHKLYVEDHEKQGWQQ